MLRKCWKFLKEALKDALPILQQCDSTSRALRVSIWFVIITRLVNISVEVHALLTLGAVGQCI